MSVSGCRVIVVVLAVDSLTLKLVLKLQGDLHIDLHIRVSGQSNGSWFYLKTLHIS